MRFRIDVSTLDGKLCYERDTPAEALHVAECGTESLGVTITDTTDGKTYSSGRALAIREKAFGQIHPATAQSLNNLGSILWEQLNHPDAQLLFERALAIDERMKGSEHPDTAIPLSNLATVFHGRGDHGEAQRLLERALAI